MNNKIKSNSFIFSGNIKYKNFFNFESLTKVFKQQNYKFVHLNNFLVSD